jgi:phage terminase large subunit-like protein
LPTFSESERLKAAKWIAKVRWTAEYEPIRFFQPHGGQQAFIDEVIVPPGLFLGTSGAGNGWGKSELIAAILTAALFPGMAPACFAKTPFMDWKHPKRARIYSTPAELEQIGSLQTALARLLPKGRYTASKGGYGYPSVFTTDTGWVLDLFSYEREAAEAAGPNIGLQFFNEPPPEDLFKEAVARSRAGGLLFMAATSLHKNPWVVDGIFGKADGKAIRVRYGNSCENCIQHGVNGNLEHERIVQILDQFDPDEREARFSGKPLSLSGRIFKGFDRSVHVAPEPFEPPKADVSLGMVCDPAIGKPLALAWWYVDRAGVVHFYDEWPEFAFEGAKDSNLTVKDYADLIRARENGRQITTRILDRHFGNVRRTLGGMTLRQEFGEAGLDFQDSYNTAEEVETGILKVKEYLAFKRDKDGKIDALSGPKLRISPKCKNLIASFERWGRDPKTAKPTEPYKDFADLARYALMSNPRVEEPSSWVPSSGAFYGVRS